MCVVLLLCSHLCFIGHILPSLRADVSQGAARWTVYGAIVVGIAHYASPVFRRQTLALKGFLVSSCEDTPRSAADV